MTGYAALQDAVDGLRYKPGWRFWLTSGATSSAQPLTDFGSSTVLTSLISTGGRQILSGMVMLHVGIITPDSGDPSRNIQVEHLFTAPPESWPGNWERWLLDRVLDVERHEAMEYFSIGGHRVFFPEHGPAGRLYEIVERAAG